MPERLHPRAAVPIKQNRLASTTSPPKRTVPETAVSDRRSPCGTSNLPVVTSERLSRAKALVERAVKLRRVFSVQGPYPVVRACLRARGWVEQRQPCSVLPKGSWPRGIPGDKPHNSTNAEDRSEESERDDTPEVIHEIMSRLVRNETVHFYWTRDSVDHCLLKKGQMSNHFARTGSFTTKVGLCVNLRNLQWFDAADPDTFFPRCYRLGAKDERQAFIEDYRRTACSSLLQCVLERSSGNAEEDQTVPDDFCPAGQRKPRANESVGSGIIDKALLVCQNFLDSLEHNDIDISMETPPYLSEQQWAEFLHNYYKIVHEDVGIPNASHYLERCEDMLRRLREVSPQLDTDGIHNIWIVKPGALSRGRGIFCVKRLEEVLRLLDCKPTMMDENTWVVQKYLERPLLIHGTKFDLRQWFLVTDWYPLTVWFYGECYLRFSTQPYSLERMDSSVHLCNNSIQKHYQPSQLRHPEIPEHNMWSSEQFRVFLRLRGQEALWEAVVVPGMKQVVVQALQTAQDLVEARRGSFELYGADFILGQDLRPWLIEINANPDMAPTTPVTAQLCLAVQEDTLRVVLDRRVDHSAITGGFQLIYKQAAVAIPPYLGMSLCVEGARLHRPHLRLRRKAVRQKAVHLRLPRNDQSKEREVEKDGAAVSCPHRGTSDSQTLQPQPELRREALPTAPCPDMLP
ncbi:hypothetical protein GJAV_G00182710 [Gymnothorax javanicus]|nr:hypothetical protein GJAV_G00182710 [Gymnothorax javanicus]